ncbi:hypothetical protein O181_030981 [Austropuccinia psidii MF-1]|uniref:Uncharacterized protein n=1 Tax=Austropuccinia psidii MF-1 TaxID=1389203 RepID=A0A9Q3CTZ2_9BASI|nr:hypothetical protein [Austropuccinia psidii MF-1]
MDFGRANSALPLPVNKKLSLLKMPKKNRPELSIGEEPVGKIKFHVIKLYLDVERPYPPMMRRPPYPAILETRKEIEKTCQWTLKHGCHQEDTTQ